MSELEQAPPGLAKTAANFATFPLADPAHEVATGTLAVRRQTRKPTTDRALLSAACLVSPLSFAWNTLLLFTGVSTDRTDFMGSAMLRRPSLCQGLERFPESIKVQMQIEALCMQEHSTGTADGAPGKRHAEGKCDRQCELEACAIPRRRLGAVHEHMHVGAAGA
ncbi:hypothetical protein OBBRIDRAFT_834968 [Obba rivulosa]|uniref:Uncharacterized protein n=1 Tax=Obba rivulosa TaxID=1052685 RepID=A0A8E2ATT0_9APHY|nr:hypothetical protein OBBRIDRAFT_834968 [Obba rivulosa]